MRRTFCTCSLRMLIAHANERHGLTSVRLIYLLVFSSLPNCDSRTSGMVCRGVVSVVEFKDTLERIRRLFARRTLSGLGQC